jgi:hypothetical protein
MSRRRNQVRRTCVCRPDSVRRPARAAAAQTTYEALRQWAIGRGRSVLPRAAVAGTRAAMPARGRAGQLELWPDDTGD